MKMKVFKQKQLGNYVFNEQHTCVMWVANIYKKKELKHV